jgi:hypothetical protein
MLGSQTQTVIGRPILSEAAVHAVVEEHVRWIFSSLIPLFCCSNLVHYNEP